jgi:hypothetical protein
MAKRLYRPPDNHQHYSPSIKHKMISSILTTRLLTFLFKLKMKAQAGIKTSDVSFFVDRITKSDTTNL